MKFSLGISNFVEEISSLSHSIVFLYFFALNTEEGFLISPCYSLKLCIQMGIIFAFKWVYLSFSPLPFVSLLFSAICKASSDNHLTFWHFFFLGTVLITVDSYILELADCCLVDSFSLFFHPLSFLWLNVMIRFRISYFDNNTP